MSPFRARVSDVLSAFSQAWASWKAAPGVALLAVVAFAVGIGATTAIFTVVNGVMLRPLPYPDGDRFVTLLRRQHERAGQVHVDDVSRCAGSISSRPTSFDAFGWFRLANSSLTAPGEPQFVTGTAVTPSLARQLGQPDPRPVVCRRDRRRHLEHPLATTRRPARHHRQRHHPRRAPLYGYRRDAAGVSTCRSSALALTSGDTEVWIPLDPSRGPRAGGNGMYFAYARRKPGVSFEQAQADVRRAGANIAAKPIPPGTRSTPPTSTGCASTSRRPARHAADPVRRRGAAAADRLRQRRHPAAGAIGGPRARDGDPRRARRVATPARAALLRRRALVSVAGAAAGILLSAIFAPADPGRRVRLHPACRRDRHRLEGARLQRRRGARHGRARRPGAAVAGDPHRAERGAHRRRSRVGRRAGAPAVEGVRRRRNRPRLHAPHGVGHSDRPPAQPRPRGAGLRARRPAHLRPRAAAARCRHGRRGGPNSSG